MSLWLIMSTNFSSWVINYCKDSLKKCYWISNIINQGISTELLWRETVFLLTSAFNLLRYCVRLLRVFTSSSLCAHCTLCTILFLIKESDFHQTQPNTRCNYNRGDYKVFHRKEDIIRVGMNHKCHTLLTKIYLTFDYFYFWNYNVPQRSFTAYQIDLFDTSFHDDWVLPVRLGWWPPSRPMAYIPVYVLSKKEQEHTWLTGGNLNCFQDIFAHSVQKGSIPPLNPMTYYIDWCPLTQGTKTYMVYG